MDRKSLFSGMALGAGIGLTGMMLGGQGQRPAAPQFMKDLQVERLEVTDAAKDFLVEVGFDHIYGARPMRRAIQNHIEDPLSEGLLHGQYKPGQTVVVDKGEEGLVMEGKGELVESA